MNEIDSITQSYACFLQARGISFDEPIELSKIDEEPPAFCIFKSVKVSPEKIVELNCELADELAQGGFTSANAARHFILGFIPARRAVLRSALPITKNRHRDAIEFPIGEKKP